MRTANSVAEVRQVFLEGLNQPFGMALVGETFYVGNTDGVVAYPCDARTAAIKGEGRHVVPLKPGGHWTRSLLKSADEKTLYVGVGSLSNIGESGMAAEEGRAAIHAIDLASGASRIFATGLRNPVGLAFEPVSGRLWTVVNERDGLGDETPPDYLTSVEEEGDSMAGPIAIGAGRWTSASRRGRLGRRPRPDAGLCARRPYRLARPVLDAGRDAAGLSRRHGHRPARLVESQHAERL